MALQDLREDLATVIATATGIQSVANLPERPVPPIALISAAAPYITFTDSTLFGELEVNLRVDIVASTGANTMSINELDEIIENTVTGLISNSWGVNEVSAPYQLQANGANYLAVTLNVQTSYKF